ncbi:substrate-binding domain-containing protein [Rhizosaccharibacter radicis]|uniref:Substrate-binding domain-containing protein n=1 Tax=Rhizosaccharibacter radicis TaxID=2782605 RepID=A0ABT1W0Z9_9PROT|nr:substrate-binding domain-containing protein [Acetobacteraceae bacterium KSS12]
MRTILAAATLACGVMAAQGASAADAKTIKIGVSMLTQTAPYYVALQTAIQKRAQALGATVVTADANGDMLKQISDVEDMLSQKIDVLVMDPKDAKGLVGATKEAAAAHVPVIIVDSSIDPSAPVLTTIQSSNSENGRLIGDWLIGKVKGMDLRIALLSGDQGNLVGEARRDGVMDGIVEAQLRQLGHAGFTIVGQGWGGWTQEGGIKAMEDLLTAHPDINAVLAENDSMALGAMRAIKDAGKSDKNILVFAAADGQKEAVKLIQDGSYGATGLNDPAVIGKMAAELAVKAANHQVPADTPKITYTPPVAITKANAAQYYHPDALF